MRLALVGALLCVSAVAWGESLPPVSVVAAHASVPMSGWDRGHLRMYLATNSQICFDDAEHDVRGDVAISFDVVHGHIKNVRAKPVVAGQMRYFRLCLPTVLKDVEMPASADAYHWEGTLRFQDPAIVVQNISWLESGMTEEVLDHVVLAALEQPAACMTAFFTAREELSATVGATVHVDETGAVRSLEVKERTVPPPGFLDCVKAQLATMSFEPGHPFGVELFLAFLRPTTAKPDDNVATFEMAPK